MRDYIKQAKDEGLDWQTSLIDDLQTQLKILIVTAIIGGWAWSLVNAAVGRVIQEADEIEIVDLRERAKSSLLNFATVEYRRLSTATRGVNLELVDKVSAYENKPTQRTAESLVTAMSQSGMSVDGVMEYGELKGQWWTIEQPLGEFSKDYMKKVRAAFGDLAKSSAKDDYASNVSLRNISEMTVRWNRKQEEEKNLKAKGVKLVWISAHANCSERCAPYQGKLYSFDDDYGEIDGYKYQPLKVATDVYTQPTSKGKSYKNGCISGFNCRHYLIPYNDGNKPLEVPADIVAQQREINNIQRAMERKVRDLRELAVTTPVKSDSTKARKAAVKAYKEYKDYCREHKVAYYPSRVQVWSEQIESQTAERFDKLQEKYLRKKNGRR
ncbi:MAG: hypothetical protein OSJ74_00125 [Clostridia bacterium]|nr:hypothetical protein [Clostridia bacterium]